MSLLYSYCNFIKLKFCLILILWKRLGSGESEHFKSALRISEHWDLKELWLSKSSEQTNDLLYDTKICRWPLAMPRKLSDPQRVKKWWGYKACNEWGYPIWDFPNFEGSRPHTGYWQLLELLLDQSSWSLVKAKYPYIQPDFSC